MWFYQTPYLKTEWKKSHPQHSPRRTAISSFETKERRAPGQSFPYVRGKRSSFSFDASTSNTDPGRPFHSPKAHHHHLVSRPSWNFPWSVRSKNAHPMRLKVIYVHQGGVMMHLFLVISSILEHRPVFLEHFKMCFIPLVPQQFAKGLHFLHLNTNK